MVLWPDWFHSLVFRNHQPGKRLVVTRETFCQVQRTSRGQTVLSSIILDSVSLTRVIKLLVSQATWEQMLDILAKKDSSERGEEQSSLGVVGPALCVTGAGGQE